jgi:hypothetical protein
MGLRAFFVTPWHGAMAAMVSLYGEVCVAYGFCWLASPKMVFVYWRVSELTPSIKWHFVHSGDAC